jgi:serine/threonine protein kinase
MVLAIEACHKLGFIHRDIKPDVRISVTPADMPAASLLDLELPF